jgi:ubiquitin-protein ligase E3 C
MHMSFSGSTRRPRQVNLSGRKTNTFGSPGTGAGSQAALDRAQQERAQRQRERDVLKASKILQRVWRGHSDRQRVADLLRREWDAVEGSSTALQTAAPYRSEEEALTQLQGLLRFAHTRYEEDLSRIRHCGFRQMETTRSLGFPSSGPWPSAYLRLQKMVLTVLERRIKLTTSSCLHYRDFLIILRFLADQNPSETSQNAKHFYRTLALIISELWTGSDGSNGRKDSSDALNVVLETVVSPLTKVTGYTLEAYEAFGHTILTLPILSADSSSPFTQKFRDSLAGSINYKLLANALATLFKSSGIQGRPELKDISSRLRLLGSFIYFHRYAHNFDNPEAYSVHKDFVTVVSLLLNSLPASIIDDQDSDSERLDDLSSSQSSGGVSNFAKEQVLSLVNQEGIGNLLSSSSQSSEASEDEKVDEARQLASYALALLRFFPRRGDDIRMWLYMGPSNMQSSSTRRLPAIRYFWEASKRSSVFSTILRDSRAAIDLLRTKPASTNVLLDSTSSRTPLQQGLWQAARQEEEQVAAAADEWRVILVFLELYTFVLKVTDDEEFFSGGQDVFSNEVRDNGLPLSEVKDLTTFLKNLGFTLYFNAADITFTEEREAPTSLGFFNSSVPEAKAQKQVAEPSAGGVPGLSFEYIKGLATGLLRMVYERDSRRKFLPSDHWLMTSRFDMTSFIPAVVEEEESRHKIEEEDAEDMDEEEEEEEDTPQLIGTSRTQQQRRIERMQREQRKASRRRYLQAVAPRLEILQNMPFMIPFTTRVQIFREFVTLDMVSNDPAEISRIQTNSL